MGSTRSSLFLSDIFVQVEDAAEMEKKQDLSDARIGASKRAKSSDCEMRDVEQMATGAEMRRGDERVKCQTEQGATE